MTGRKFKDTYFEAKNRDEEEPLLQVENLSLENCFKNVSFELFAGEILGITGLLGSGRNELAQSLFGLLPADSGRILIKGKSVKVRSVRDAISNKISYVPEDRLTEGLFMPQSIGRNIIISSLKSYLTKMGFIKDEVMDIDIKKCIEQFKIATPSAKLPVQALSGGNQQRVVLAKWLATDPVILILNGPTVGVDIGSKYDIHQILRELTEEGLGVIIISDDIPEVLYNCNRILIIRNGVLTNEVIGKKTNSEELTNLMAGTQ